MLKLTIKLIPFRAIKLLFKILASLASAIVVVSGFLLFVSNIDRNKETDQPAEDSNPNDIELDANPDTD